MLVDKLWTKKACGISNSVKEFHIVKFQKVKRNFNMRNFKLRNSFSHSEIQYGIFPIYGKFYVRNLHSNSYIFGIDYNRKALYSGLTIIGKPYIRILEWRAENWKSPDKDQKHLSHITYIIYAHRVAGSVAAVGLGSYLEMLF